MTPLANGASLRIGGSIEVIPKAGRRIMQCSQARFEQPSVRVRFISAGDVPYPDRYDSKTEDRGVLVSDRIGAGLSYFRFFRWESPSPTPVPAGKYAGMFSIEVTAAGQVIALVGKSKNYIDNSRRLQSVMIGEFGTPVAERTKLVALRDPCSFQVKSIVDCSGAGQDYVTKASYFYAPKGDADIESDKGYFMTARDASSVAIAGVPAEFMRMYLSPDATIKDPEEAKSVRLDELLNEMTVAIAVKDRNKLKKTESLLTFEYPKFFPKSAASK